MTREEILDRLRALLPELQREFAVASIGLFGSVARGDMTADSDLDFFVSFAPGADATLTPLFRLLDRLEDEFGARVDLVEDHPRLAESFRTRVNKDLIRVA
jgi:predicted nucleotidyltransferase